MTTSGASRIMASRARVGWWCVGAAVAVALIVLLATTEAFFTVDNARAILASVGIIGIIAVGMTIVILGGNLFSLALAPTLACAGMLFIVTFPNGWALAILVALAFGVGTGWIQGLAVGAGRANPIIVTIATAGLLEAASRAFKQGRVQADPKTSFGVLTDTVWGLPVTVYVLIGLVICVECALRRTRRGRELLLVGTSRPAARAAGLPVARITVGAFGVAGACAAIGGILLSALNAGAGPQLQGTLTFDAFAATLVGGTALAGGRGSALRTLGGTLVVAVIANALLLRGYDTGVQQLVLGVLVLGAIIVFHASSRQST